MNYLEAIVQIDNIVGDIFCKEIMDYYKNIDLKSLGVVDPSDHTSRNVLGKHLDCKEDKVIFDKINKKSEGEDDMLDQAFEPNTFSRLSCQISVSN